MQGDRDERDAFAEKLFQSALGYFDLLSIRLGQRLGLYEVLAEGPVTSRELASRTGTAERYAQEWLEHPGAVMRRSTAAALGPSLEGERTWCCMDIRLPCPRPARPEGRSSPRGRRGA